MKITASSMILSMALINSLMFISCSKEEEAFNPPRISWQSPGEGSVFNALDTVLLKATIEDDKIISLIKIRLKNEQGVPILQIPDIYPVSKRLYELKVEFPLNKVDLNGSFYFEIEAYDDVEFAASFRHVSISKKPLTVDHFLFFSNDKSKSTVYTLKDNTLYTLTTLEGDFLATAVDDPVDQVYISSEYSGNIYAIEPSFGYEVWTESNPGLPFGPAYVAMSEYEGNVLVSSPDRLFALDRGGQIIHTSLFEPGFGPGNAMLHANTIIYEEIDRSSGDIHLKSQYFPQGQIKGDVLFKYGRIVGMFTLDWNEILIFSNEGRDQYITRFNTEENQLISIDHGSIGEYGAMERLNDNIIVMTRGTGLYRYDIKQGQFLSLVNNFAPDCIRFNRADLFLYALKGDQLKMIDHEKGDILNESTLPVAMRSMELLYNY